MTCTNRFACQVSLLVVAFRVVCFMIYTTEYKKKYIIKKKTELFEMEKRRKKNCKCDYDCLPALLHVMSVGLWHVLDITIHNSNFFGMRTKYRMLDVLFSPAFCIVLVAMYIFLERCMASVHLILILQWSWVLGWFIYIKGPDYMLLQICICYN